MATLNLELHQLVRRYSTLRIQRPGGDGKLMSSLAQQGQCTPLLVCPDRGGQGMTETETATQYVLIDGYRRVQALERLGRDIASATVTELPEEEALIWHHQMESRGRRTALEEAWLLYELEQCFGFGRDELARKFARSESWISRRLALVEMLPESVQQMVRKGTLCAYSAQKYLVPLARANPEDCEALAYGLAEHRLSTRATRCVYVAWRDGDAEQRHRIIHQPQLFVASSQALDRKPAEPEGTHQAALTGAYCVESDEQLTDALDQLTALSGCICRGIERRDRTVERQPTLQRAWSRAREILATTARILEEAVHAGQ